MIRYRYTRHQVPRGALPDAETRGRIYLLKNVSTLHATYQLRLLAMRASETGKKLVVRIPKSCRLCPDLAAFRQEYPRFVEIERV